MRTCFTISSPAMINICKGVYTNKKTLVIAILNFAKTLNNSKITYSGVLGYETRAFTYANTQRLLQSILVGERFAIKIQYLSTETDSVKSIVFEITRHSYNNSLNV